MSHKGSWHRIGNIKEYGSNLEKAYENTRKALEKNTEHCTKHNKFNPYCLKCWDANEAKAGADECGKTHN